MRRRSKMDDGSEFYSFVRALRALDSADVALLREALTKVVLPAFVKRCGARCGEIYNRVVSPISGVSYVAQ